ncbi:type VI secretion system Vgr family protein [Marivita sp.]|uniref:type VI secretion system Vgr family protein n=1 Tax=Marivita sp. TaxID=2003365 RepID=UPI003F72D6AA
MLKNLDPSKFPLRLEGDCKDKELLPIAARVHERINEVSTIDVHFFCVNEKLDLESIVGKSMHLVVESEDKKKKRWFRGTCISAEFISLLDDGGQFRAVVRPWLWFLTRRTDLRIYQEMNVTDIIQSVLGEYGFSGDLQLRLSNTYEPREYCVQYRETDLDFLHRLMEEEGIYYYFDHSGDTEKMVLIDDSGKHDPVESPAALEFRAYSMRSNNETTDPYVFEWSGNEQVRSAKVVLDDYNFETSTAVLTSESKKLDAGYLIEGNERYDYPGHFRNSGLGDQYARVRMESEVAPHHTVSGVSDAVHFALGHTFKVTKLPRDADPKEVMLIECDHDIVQMEAFNNKIFDKAPTITGDLDFDVNVEEPHMVKFRAFEASKQYRAPQKTPWPKVGGIHTAVVTGPSGEEIYTDEYGRIKVQFHWDRDGNKDEQTTCWVRTMMPWTGKNWGAIAIPRIGQEVVISFEEGDPDRPMCIGMLYNDKTMPPYALPENKTQSGVKTNSSKGGGGFNELMFEDKKGEELVRFQAEKDYEQIVKNNATITIGLEKKDPGDLTQTVHNDVTETINEGTYTETVKKGDHITNIDTGDHNTTLKMGNMDVSVKSGKITVSAAQSIEFKCGGSTIKMDPMSITMKSPTITVKADMKADVKSPMTTVSGDMMLTLKGGVVMIN